MSENNKTYRIRTGIGEQSDRYVSLNLNQDIDVLELLSLKVDTTNFYKLHTSNYGCIAGRVLANGGVGIPNAKISIFIAASGDTTSDPVLSELYPFTTSFSKDENGIRYNLFPDTQVSVCHTKIGTFPDKRLVLDDDNVKTIFDKYYKYTTRTNDAGDYMIFGVPVGDTVVHTDIDLSDIGILSQKPRDMIYKGYNITQFENANKFKKDVNIDNLTQVISQNDTVYVYPFWGDDTENDIRITRNDISIQYKFEPSCVFIGSLVTDESSNGVMTNCIASDRMGKMDKLTTGSGTIEMIRKTPDGNIEQLVIQGNQLIDGNGTWCYQIPMNLDYYMTDEYGNLVPSDDKEKGIPTRARVRFRVSMNDFESTYENSQLAKVLIPNNPKKYEDLDYHFGSMAKDDEFGTKSFRDLFWNNVYTVKSYIPRIQRGNWNHNKHFTGFKQTNVSGSNNPIPYNNMRVNLTFMFILQCAILKTVIAITAFVNSFRGSSYGNTCSVIGDGICPDLENWYFAPGCPEEYLRNTLNAVRIDVDSESNDSTNSDDTREKTFCITNKTKYLLQCVEINLAMEYEVIQFDFYNDWINGMIYVPRWFVNIKKKKSYLFGTLQVQSRVEACMEDTFSFYRRYVQQCSLTYTRPDDSNYYTKIVTPIGCSSDIRQKCHKGYGRNHVKVFKGKGGGGLVHNESMLSGEKVYYFKPAEWLNVNNSKYNTRCIMFATDIVLLGSLDDYNQYGIPKAFEELVPSTYLMPSNLAATNMDKDGYMYGSEGHGTRCSGKKYLGAPITTFNQTYDQYVEWSKNTDYFEPSAEDALEYPVTLASGIDWGYTGPGQGTSSLEQLYFPGGHFLGIACFGAAVNIKSCVNLSRICEIGSSMSQRRLLVTGINDNKQLEYANVIPTGLIDGYAITGSSFRKMFATMNNNGLKTKINPETSYLEYQFTPLLPTGFNGELKEFTNSSEEYNGPIHYETGDGRNQGSATSTLEATSDDYYCFRMGITEDDEKDQTKLPSIIKNKYLIQSGNKVSLPMYENSFYFYFGLKDGNTAIERFLKDFHARCNYDDDDATYVAHTVHDKNACPIGDESDTGSVDIQINNVDSPYTMMLTKDDPYSYTDVVMVFNSIIPGDPAIITPSVSNRWYESRNSVIMHNFPRFTLDGLDTGNYTLTIASEGIGSVNVRFTISEYLTGPLADATASSEDFKNGYYEFDEDKLARRTDLSSGGTITINDIDNSVIIGVMVFTDEKYTIISTSNRGSQLYTIFSKKYTTIKNMTSVASGSTWFDETEKKIYMPVWRGNDDYNVVLLGMCNTGNAFNDVASLFVKMDTPLDVYVGDNDLSYLNTLYKYVLGTTVPETWILSGLTNNNSDFGAKKIWNIKESTFYRDSMYDLTPYGNIELYPGNGIPPYNEVEKSPYEAIEQGDGYKTINYTSNREFSAQTNNGDMHQFYFPTHTISMDSEGKLGLNFLGPWDFIGINDSGNWFWNYVTAYSTTYLNLDADKAFKIPFKMTSMYLNIGQDDDIEAAKQRAIPSYHYRVEDKSVNKGNIKEIVTPSIYRPFYYNGLMMIYDGTVTKDEHNNYVSTTAVCCVKLKVNNPIVYNKKLGGVKINGTDYNNRFNISDDELANEFKNKSWSLDTRIINFGSMTYTGGSTNFSVEVTDGHPDNYQGDIAYRTIGNSASCIFPTPQATYYTGGVRFYVIGSESAAHRYDWARAYLTWSILDENYWHFNDWVSPERRTWGCTYNGIFGGQGTTDKNAKFNIVLRDVTEGVYNAFYGTDDTTKTPWRRFLDFILRETGQGNEYDGTRKEPYVLAIYDNFTMNEASTERSLKNMFGKVTPDTNIMAIAKLYSPDELYAEIND